MAMATEQTVPGIHQEDDQAVAPVRGPSGDVVAVAISGAHGERGYIRAIPGAINIPYEQNWIDPETPAKLSRKQMTSNAGMSLKSVGDRKRLYARFDPNKQTIVYCQSGARASETANALSNVKTSALLAYGTDELFHSPQAEVDLGTPGLRRCWRERHFGPAFPTSRFPRP
jgi:rhodanese-related sulfurtransferase